MLEGRPWPLGAQVRDGGVNFAVFSDHATRVELCLFDDEGLAGERRLVLPGRSGNVRHGFLPGAGPGLVYGLRAHGPWLPEAGHRFNPDKLLLDPCAREIVGEFVWDDIHLGHRREQPGEPDTRDNAAQALKARVVGDDGFDWLDDRPVHPPRGRRVIYEAHLRGFTRRLPGVPPAQRGRYGGLASEAAIAHLKALGVTTVSLLPVQQFLDERRLVDLGLVNHWGYNTIGFFCPAPRYASTNDGRAARDEFRAMVRTLHAAGIEVLIDVVFNHTAESDGDGPTIAWRGLDNAAWYRHGGVWPRELDNYSGCGNTLDLRHPRVLQFVCDVLRYWVREMHVDGFRFDLAPVLGRGEHGFDRAAPFFQVLSQDPVLAGVTLVAEPWDLGPGGYRLGGFPDGWLEWNDRFRDTMRAFWLGGDCTRGEFAHRLCASAGQFQHGGREPAESVNYIVSHDGFTLRDLLTYEQRHNQANGEGNRDGHAHNLGWNCGHEGPTTDPDVLQRRERLQRALLATLLLSQGTPMLAAGDELGHSQQGNNNPYCQDNETTWIDWAAADEDLMAYTTHLLALRRRHGPFGNHWYTGQPGLDGRVDLAWQRRGGETPGPGDWNNRLSRALIAVIGAPAAGGATVLLLVNARDADSPFRLPPGHWRLELDSAEARGWRPWSGNGGGDFLLRERSIVMLVAEPGQLAA